MPTWFSQSGVDVGEKHRPIVYLEQWDPAAKNYLYPVLPVKFYRNQWNTF